MTKRNRITWNSRKASSPPAIPGYGVEDQDHPAHQPDPAAERYENGDTSAWAEDVNPPPYAQGNPPATPGYDVEDQDHPAHESPPRVPREASLREIVERKAAKCARIASQMLGAGASSAAIEDQALALMDLPDAQINATLARMGGGMLMGELGDDVVGMDEDILGMDEDILGMDDDVLGMDDDVLMDDMGMEGNMGDEMMGRGVMAALRELRGEIAKLRREAKKSDQNDPDGDTLAPGSKSEEKARKEASFLRAAGYSVAGLDAEERSMLAEMVAEQSKKAKKAEEDEEEEEPKASKKAKKAEEEEDEEEPKTSKKKAKKAEEDEKAKKEACGEMDMDMVDEGMLSDPMGLDEYGSDLGEDDAMLAELFSMKSASEEEDEGEKASKKASEEEEEEEAEEGEKASKKASEEEEEEEAEEDEDEGESASKKASERKLARKIAALQAELAAMRKSSKKAEEDEEDSSKEAEEEEEEEEEEDEEEVAAKKKAARDARTKAAKAQEAMRRTASAQRPQPRKPNAGIRSVGGMSRVAGTRNEIGELEELWESAPDVSDVFNS